MCLPVYTDAQRAPDVSAVEGVQVKLRGDGLQLTQRGEPGERLALQLADALSSQIKLVPDRLERPRLALEAEAKLEDSPLALRKGVECATHALAAQRLLGLLERIGSLAV